MTRTRITARGVRAKQVAGPVCAEGTVTSDDDGPSEPPGEDDGLSREALLTGAAVVGGYLLTS